MAAPSVRGRCRVRGGPLRSKGRGSRGRLVDGVGQAERLIDDSAAMTAGAIANSTNEGSVQTTSGNESRTGRRRASASCRRLLAARASFARDWRTGPSGAPFRSALATTSTSPTVVGSRGVRAAPRVRRRTAAPRSMPCTTAAKPDRHDVGATPASSRTACTGVRPAWISSTNSSTASGIERSRSSRRAALRSDRSESSERDDRPRRRPARGTGRAASVASDRAEQRRTRPARFAGSCAVARGGSPVSGWAISRRCGRLVVLDRTMARRPLPMSTTSSITSVAMRGITAVPARSVASSTTRTRSGAVRRRRTPRRDRPRSLLGHPRRPPPTAPASRPGRR